MPTACTFLSSMSHLTGSPRASWLCTHLDIATVPSACNAMFRRSDASPLCDAQPVRSSSTTVVPARTPCVRLKISPDAARISPPVRD
jgi:hypothetical protein